MVKHLPSSMASASVQSILAIDVAVLFLCFLSFSGTLEIHHVFADSDHDGHTHSDFDLCDWVQVHGSEAIELDYVNIGILMPVDHERWSSSEIVLFSIARPSQESRGPPLFF